MKPERCRGQALVEAALVLPILLLVLVGIMEVGRAWNIHQVVTHAAREGARAAAVWHDAGASAARDSARNVAGRSLTAASIAFDPVQDIDVAGEGPASAEVTVTVDIAYNFILLGPVMSLAGGTFADNVIQLKSSAVMRNE
jgi:Flp pilus assembly protein TadG